MASLPPAGFVPPVPYRGPSRKGVAPPPANFLLARYKPFGLPTFNLYRADILQFVCDAMVVVTDNRMNFDRNTTRDDGQNRCRPGYYSWRIIADGIVVPGRVPGQRLPAPAGSTRPAAMFDAYNDLHFAPGAPAVLLPGVAHATPSRGLANVDKVVIANLDLNPFPNVRGDDRTQKALNEANQRALLNTVCNNIMVAAIRDPYVPLPVPGVPAPAPLRKARSISIPLIGYGPLKYPAGTAADELLQAVILYLRTPTPLGLPPSWSIAPRRLRSINFIITPGGGRGAIEEQIAFSKAWRTHLEDPVTGQPVDPTPPLPNKPVPANPQRP